MRSGYYRPDIDGLRAIAVLSVVIFHAFPGHLLGGFVGVDIFFVISGYLITGDLHRRSLENAFSIREFYMRRIRRIFPALALVAFSVLVFGAFTLSAYAFQQVGAEVAAASAFIANVYYWQTLNYFSAVAITKPMLHLWSLGVEEQFYILWPILIFVSSNRRGGPIAYILIIALLSLAYSLYAVQAAPAEAFFSPLPRLWELAAGGALAVIKQRPRGIGRDALSVGGLICLIASLFVVREVGFPGYQALLPVLSTVAIITAGPSALANRLLGMRGPVAIGLISYPLYLWHWPILSYAYITAGEAHGSALYRLGLVILAIGLATLTYVVVEPRGRRANPIMLLAVIAAIGVAGGATYAAAGWPERPAALDPANAMIGQYEQLHHDGLSSAYMERCDFLGWRQQDVRTDIDPSCTSASFRPVWMLWGDSHAQALSLGLRQALPAGTSFVQVATSACTPQWAAETLARRAPGSVGDACVRSNNLAVATISRLRPDVLIISMDAGYDRDWSRFAAQAKGLGAKRIVLVGPVPQYDPSLPVLMARALPGRPELLAATPGPLAQDRSLRAIRSANFRYVSPISMLCHEGRCRTSIGRSLTAVDGSHLSPTASVFVGRQVASEILAER